MNPTLATVEEERTNTFSSKQERIAFHNKVVASVAKLVKGPRDVVCLEPFLTPRSCDSDEDLPSRSASATFQTNPAGSTGRRGDILLRRRRAGCGDDSWQQRVTASSKQRVREGMAAKVPRAKQEDISRIIGSLSGASEVLDVRVLNPWAPSYLPRGTNNPAGVLPAAIDMALAGAEAVKQRKYDRRALGYRLKDLQVDFIPICVTPLGVLGKTTHSFLDRLMKTEQARRGEAAGLRWRRYWLRTLSSEILHHTITSYRNWEAKELAKRSRRGLPITTSSRLPTTPPPPVGGGVDSSRRCL